MTRKDFLNARTLLLGFASWAAPFAASFLFFGPHGALLIPQPLFKSLMILIGGACGAFLLLRAFRRMRPTFRAGLALGLFWLALNLALDLAILVPMAGMTLSLYVEDIGLRYLLIPIMAAAMGRAAEIGRNG